MLWFVSWWCTAMWLLAITNTIHLTLKMTSAQVVETSVTNNSSFQNYSHPDDHTIRTTDTPGFKPFTKSPSYCSKAVTSRDSAQNSLQSLGFRVLSGESQGCCIWAKNEQWHQREHHQLWDLWRFPSSQSPTAITDKYNRRLSLERNSTWPLQSGRSYIVLVDYCSNFLEITELPNTLVSSVIQL